MNMDHMFIMRLAALLFGGGIASCLFPGKFRMSHVLLFGSLAWLQYARSPLVYVGGLVSRQKIEEVLNQAGLPDS